MCKSTIGQNKKNIINNKKIIKNDWDSWLWGLYSTI
jgi:hypothetical protein